MENATGLLISKSDYEKLALLIQQVRTNTADLLQLELDRAHVVDSDSALSDVVSMNSTVEYRELDTGKINTVTLVYPESADIQSHRISVLAPIGAALIGLRVGQSISWPLPHGKEKTIEVVKVSKADGV